MSYIVKISKIYGKFAMLYKTTKMSFFANTKDKTPSLQKRNGLYMKELNDMRTPKDELQTKCNL